jgi:biotin carboxylase
MDQPNQNAILVVGGKAIGSMDIVKYTKELGFYTIVTDNLAITSTNAKSIADEVWDISTAETQILQNRIKERNIQAVFTGIHEFNIRKTLSIANHCGLPFYATAKQLETTSNKSIYKKIFQEFDIPVATEYNLHQKNDIIFPVLVKPVDGSSGKGISICHHQKELEEGMIHALQFSSQKKFLIEKYFSKKEVTIFYIIQNGEIFLSAMADRVTHAFDPKIIPLPVQYEFPSQCLSSFLQNQNQKTILALQSMGLKNGMVFIQAFVDQENFIFYDMGYRLTGTQEYNILENICGFNPLKMLVDYALTQKMGDFDVQPMVDPYFGGKLATIITFLIMPGTIARFVGLDQINGMKGVIKTVMNYEVGDNITDAALGTLQQVVCRVYAIHANIEQRKKMTKQVKNTFDVISTTNRSMVIRDNY